ncbi:MAG: hypothetical protein V3S21_07320 [Xanthomonadales bacterium]
MKTTIEAIFCMVMPVLGLSYLIQPGQWIQFLSELTHKPHRSLPTALVMLTAGTFSGFAYNDWTTTWPIFISAFSWLLALEGGLILVYPASLAQLQKIPHRWLNLYLRSGGIAFIILGVMLCRHFFDFPPIG